jgi:tetratricopeptide (TPR) repeat protein
MDNPAGNTDRKKQLEVVRIQLRGHRVSDIFTGMANIRRWLQDNPEDQDTYRLLTDLYSDADLRPEIRNLLLEMTQKGSKSAEDFLKSLPVDAGQLMADADDAFYTAEYDQAIKLYRQVLKIEPKNIRAKEQLDKAEGHRINVASDADMPRDAIQYFRRARSFIATGDFKTATNLLRAAIEAAAARGRYFDDAYQLLQSIENLVVDNSQEGLKQPRLSISEIYIIRIAFIFLIAAIFSALINLGTTGEIFIWGLGIFGIVGLLWSLVEKMNSRLAGDETTDAPPPDVRKKKRKVK